MTVGQLCRKHIMALRQGSQNADISRAAETVVSTECNVISPPVCLCEGVGYARGGVVLQRRCCQGEIIIGADRPGHVWQLHTCRSWVTCGTDIGMCGCTRRFDTPWNHRPAVYSKVPGILSKPRKFVRAQVPTDFVPGVGSSRGSVPARASPLLSRPPFLALRCKWSTHTGSESTRAACLAVSCVPRL